MALQDRIASGVFISGTFLGAVADDVAIADGWGKSF